MFKKSFAFMALAAVASASHAEFFLMAAETPPGNNPPANWGGIQRYSFASSGAAAVTETGIASNMVSDPYGITRSADGEFFIGNRHGNSGQSSISRFVLDGGDNFVANGVLTNSSMHSTHGMGFQPGTGNLYAISAHSQMSLFTQPGFNNAGNLPIAGQRDMAFNAAGTDFYSTQANGSLRRYNVGSGVSTFFNIAGASNLHQIVRNGNDLYAADFGSGGVYRIVLNGAGDVASSSLVANVAGAIGVAFSTDGQEMFVAGHQTANITRFMFDTNTQTWGQTGVINTGALGIGNLYVYDPVPEPATMLVLGAGAAVLARRRRR